MVKARLYGFPGNDERICGEILSEYIGSLECVGAARAELQRLKPLRLWQVNVVAEATTHKPFQTTRHKDGMLPQIRDRGFRG